jgi:NDP-sugar pyrophosphorylase family protein
MRGDSRWVGGERVRTAVVLAAGLGDRLGPLTWDRPKCLVAVDGTPILQRLVQTLDEYGIERLVVVAGYKGEMIIDYLGESFGDIAIDYVVSRRFATTNTMYSLWLARDEVDEATLLIEGDVVFDGTLLEPLLRPDRIAVSRQLPWMSGTTVTLDSDGTVDALYSPPPGVYFKHCTDPDHLMTVNICSLGRDTWRVVRERLDRHIAAGHTGYFHDVVFAELIEERIMALQAVRFPEGRWYEVDTPADRKAAESVVARLPRTSENEGAARRMRGGAR